MSVTVTITQIDRIPEEVRNLLPAHERFLAALGMTGMRFTAIRNNPFTDCNYTGLARKLNRKDAKSAKTKPFFESLCVLCVFAVSNWLHLNSYYRFNF